MSHKTPCVRHTHYYANCVVLLVLWRLVSGWAGSGADSLCGVFTALFVRFFGSLRAHETIRQGAFAETVDEDERARLAHRVQGRLPLSHHPQGPTPRAPRRSEDFSWKGIILAQEPPTSFSRFLLWKGHDGGSYICVYVCVCALIYFLE